MDPQKWKQSPIYLAVKDILAGVGGVTKKKHKAVLHTSTQDYPVFKVLTVETARDYVENIMDDVMVIVMIPVGDYAFLVYPNKDNLEITISTTLLKGVSAETDESKRINEVRYKAVFDPNNPSIAGMDLSSTNQRTLNNGGFLEIRLRLMDRNVEPLRIKTVQGVYRGVTAEQLIKALVLGESQKILIEGQPAVTGLDLVPPDSTQPNAQIVIPSGTRIAAVPTILQTKGNGVYKYGIGTYYQRFGENIPTWFIFPIYNFDRFDGGSEQKTVIFYSAPPKFTTGSENTYRENGNLLEVVVTTEKYMINPADINQLNEGVGYRMADQSAFMKKPVMIDDTGAAIGARGNLNQEVGFVERKDGLNYAPVLRGANSNPYNEMSKIAARQAVILLFAWENSDESKLYPGMPCKYCYMLDDQMVEVKGSVLGVHSTDKRQGNIAEPDRYACRSIISVAAELPTQLPEYDEEEGFNTTR